MGNMAISSSPGNTHSMKPMDTMREVSSTASKEGTKSSKPLNTSAIEMVRPSSSAFSMRM